VQIFFHRYHAHKSAVEHLKHAYKYFSVLRFSWQKVTKPASLCIYFRNTLPIAATGAKNGSPPSSLNTLL
jgi:hypothetical protein